MSKLVWATPGESSQQVGGPQPTNAVRMEGERPSPDHVAQNDGSWFYPEEEVNRRNFKNQREKSVKSIKVTTAAGNTFDGDETSQTRMTRSIVVMTDTDTITWVLADNTELQATKAELIEALKLAGQEQSRLWTPTEETV